MFGIAIGACTRDPEPHSAPAGNTFDAAPLVVAPREIPLLYTVAGSVVSDERVEISSRTTAYLRSVEVREGERVRQGQMLASLDHQDIEARIRAATAARDQASASQADATRDAENSAKLFSGGVVTETYQRKAKLALAAANETLRAAEAELSRAQAERQYSRILSPVSGVVVSRQRRVGDLITPGAPLLTVESDTALLFRAEVPEQRVAEIRVGDAVAVYLDALKRSVPGEVLRRIASGDPVTRNFEVKIALSSTTGVLPGMFGRAQFSAGHRQALVVPASALTERGGLNGVFVVGPDRRLQFRWLRTGPPSEGGILVEAGLEAGEAIVQTVAQGMRDGDRLAAEPVVN